MTPMYRRAGAIIAGLLAVTNYAPAQTPGIAYEVVYSMQTAELLGNGPVARLLEGSDGALYGNTRSGGVSNTGSIFKINKDGTGQRTLHLFGAVPQDGARPFAQLVKGSDGLLYGTTENGGISNVGTMFRIGEDGDGYKILRHFVPATGSRPRGLLLLGDDERFYSTTAAGGTLNVGVIYSVNQDGTDYRVLRQFGTISNDGGDSQTGMIRGSDAVLYGVTYAGGIYGGGTVFRINQDGTGYSILRHFDRSSADGGGLKAGVFEAKDGFLYGTTQVGAANEGTLFRLSKDGTAFQVLHRFNPAAGDGQTPWGDLIEGSDGAIYGTTYGSNFSDPGLSVLFKYQPSNSTFAVICRFPGETSSVRMHCGVQRGSDGFLYGATESGGPPFGGIVFRIDERGTNYTKLFNFAVASTGERTPRSSVAIAADGQLYGTTELGGRSNFGAIYGIDRDGSHARTLKHFGGPGDGRTPNGIMAASDGFLYGTTQSGGAIGQGILYRIATNGGSYTNLRSFPAQSADGRNPRGALVESIDGFLYGTTSAGGPSNRGTIFRIGKDGLNYGVIYNFLVLSNGAVPRDLIEGSDGILYGITSSGGITNRGTVYRCSRDGTLFEILHRFEGAADGHGPEGGLVEASDGYLYGTTTGNSTNRGTIFRLQKNGSDYAVIWRFTAGVYDGRNPRGALVEDLQGNLVGATSAGGVGNGNIFSISKDGARYDELWRFGILPFDALRSVAGVVRASSGTCYGVAEAGGLMGGGAVFRFDPQRVPLSIARQGSAVVLEWPPSSTLDQLQHSPGASGSPWTQVPEPVFDVGNRFRVTVPNASEPHRVFRVRRSWP
jgi:uncharacterized repeat protein (TIGR03803 family)